MCIHLRKQSGLSIVEALVTMVILLIVFSGVYQIFRSNSLTYRVQEGLSRLQENGRFAMEFLINDIRMAGYLGCISNGTPPDTTLNSSDSIYNFSVGLKGFEAQNATWVPAVDASIVNPLPGSDIITVRSLIGSSVSIAETMPDNSADLKTAPVPSGKAPPVANFDIVLISDCSKKAAVFQVTNYTLANGNLVHNTGVGVPGNSTKNLGYMFQKGAEILKIANTSYYVRNNPAGNTALYRRVGSASADEIVEGVENMQILYSTGLSYKNATGITNWNEVRSVQIGLLLSTPVRGIDPDTTIHHVLGTSIGPKNDMRLRRVFTATVALRNRLK